MVAIFCGHGAKLLRNTKVAAYVGKSCHFGHPKKGERAKAAAMPLKKLFGSVDDVVDVLQRRFCFYYRIGNALEHCPPHIITSANDRGRYSQIL